MVRFAGRSPSDNNNNPLSGRNAQAPLTAGRGRFDRYFEELLAEYETVCLQLGDRSSNPYCRKVDEFLARVKAEPDSLKFEEYMLVEKAIVMIEPDEALRRHAWQLRERYQAL